MHPAEQGDEQGLAHIDRASRLGEVEVVIRAVQAHVELVAPGQRVLDMCCGFGRHAIALAHRGMRVTGGVAQLGRTITLNGAVAGRVCSSGYSPYQDCGVSLVRMDDAANGPGTAVTV